MLPFYLNIKLAISNFYHLSDIFTQRGLQAPTISVGKMVSSNLFYESLAMFGYPLFFILNFCYKKKYSVSIHR